MELYQANRQWSTRPDDEKFRSLQEVYDATKAYADSSRELEDVQAASLRVENVDGEIQLTRGATPATLTHWAFGQLSNRIGAPASYLRTLPATLAAQNINHGLAKRVEQQGDQSTVNLLFHKNGGLVLRSITSDRYMRIWNYEIAAKLLELESTGLWEPARPDINAWADDGTLPLYASDHDMFCFIRSQNVIREPGNPDGLRRGAIVSNSEVGAGKLLVLWFLYRAMCGNHIIWGAQDVIELAVRHVGNARDRMGDWQLQLQKYVDSSAAEDERKIAAAQTRTIAATKDEVLDLVFGKRTGLTRKAIAAGYDATIADVDGDPRTVWGLLQGVTRYSQTIPYADERTTIDRAAGKLLDLSF